jgi:heme-degrading monooxygenase HmoA
MYARVSTAQVQPGRLDELLSVSQDSVLPAAQQQQGFRGGLWLTDPDTNKAMIVTLWETKEEMEAGERSGYYREQVGKFGGMLAGEVVREAYEVGIQA